MVCALWFKVRTHINFRHTSIQLEIEGVRILMIFCIEP